MNEQELNECGNQLAVQRFLTRYLTGSFPYANREVAGASVIVEPSRHRTGIPADAACRRYVVTHVGQGWSMVVRAVWRGDSLYSPAAVHTRIDHLWDDDGRHGGNELTVAAAVNRWLQGLPL